MSSREGVRPAELAGHVDSLRNLVVRVYATGADGLSTAGHERYLTVIMGHRHEAYGTFLQLGDGGEQVLVRQFGLEPGDESVDLGVNLSEGRGPLAPTSSGADWLVSHNMR